MKISAVISAYNEEAKIKDCLKSLDFVDEIIFVDNESTDNTREIAKEFTSKIFSKENKAMLNINKNLGFEKASGDWIISIDADERISPELAREIKKVIDNPTVDGYWIPRRNIIFGKWIEYTGWYPDNQLRLFRNGKGKFPEKHVHEMVKVEGEVNKLTEHLTHLNYETISQFIDKQFNIYALSEAENMISSGYLFNWKDCIGMPVKEFLSRFFARQGYRDGLHGLVLSLLMAFYYLYVVCLIWEKQGFKEYNNKGFLEDMEKEYISVSKDFSFWFLNEKIKNTKSMLKKIQLKIKKRIY